VSVLLYSDNFESDLAALLPPAGWTNEPSTLLGLFGYTVAVDGTKVLKGPGGNTGFPSAVAGSTSWTDYKVSADIKVDPTSGHARVIARHQSAGNFYACGLDAGGQLTLAKVSGGTRSTISTASYSFSGTTWYHIDFSVQGSALTCTVTESGTARTATLTASSGYFSNGSIGATGEYGAEYDNYTVYSLP
jgi:pectate lyase